MFTDKVQEVIDLAKDYAFSSGSAALGISDLLAAVGSHTEAGVLLAECIGLSPDKLRAVCPEYPDPVNCPGSLPLAETMRVMLDFARDLAEEVPNRFRPGLIDLRHLVCALAAARDACVILNVTPISREDAVILLTTWYDKQIQSPQLTELTERLRAMRADLLSKVYGQNHAVYAFVEGLFNAEVVATADTKRRAPRALFVFAGPPGVGKTYLAELGASCLERPFKRFDMSAFSGHQQNEALVGISRSFRGAHPGILTEFVEKNPDAVLLFDEIEKSHIKTIQLFLQLLDAGILEDKYYERNVSFCDTTIIFTTNVGRKLYDRPNESGVHSANASFHRKTILDALETEKDPETGLPFFPSAICSRLAAGYPVLFNYLRVNELERVVQTELTRVGGLLERQYYKQVTFHELLSLCLVLKEGARSDARTLRSQTETFVKNELFNFCQLFKTERLEEALEQAKSIHFMLENDRGDQDPEVAGLFEPPGRPRVLLVADMDLSELYHEFIPEVDWRIASTADDALDLLAEEEVDMILLDLWLGRSTQTSLMTIQHFDHTPAAAKSLDQGQETLRKIRNRLPNIPVFLLSLSESDDTEGHGSIDEELFMACIRGGGARGMVVSCFIDGMVKGWQEHRDRFAAGLVETCRRLHREKTAEQMGQERKVLTFDTVPQIDKEKGQIIIRLRNLRLSRAVAAADAGEILEEVERPCTQFKDVIGATAAKEELQFFINYLKNPRRFAALGLKPPKGVLLYGPPGTGKTMLARAMAGESNVAFVPTSGTNFVTIWQGSGPQNVRELFARARRYAPAVIFIDEIDAIGKVRSGSSGAGQAEENTLNALLTEMDGFTNPSPDRPIFVLGATNFKVITNGQESPERSVRTLDPALVRRFSRTILVDLPDAAARKEYLTQRIEMAKRANVSTENIELLSEKSVGMTIANLEQVIEFAGREAAKRDMEITGALLLEALDNIREGEAKHWDPGLLETTAYHEAGHTVMYWLSGWWAPEVSIIARADHGGGMLHNEAETKRESRTRKEILATRIRTALGGRAAEILHSGPEAGLSTGAWGDLEKASDAARQMVCVWGMDDEFGPFSVSDVFKYAEAKSGPTYEKINEAARKILKEQMDETLKILGEHHSELETVAKALVKKNTLYRKDLQQILPSIPEKDAQP